jgi:hypothetical protein
LSRPRPPGRSELHDLCELLMTLHEFRLNWKTSSSNVKIPHVPCESSLFAIW